MKETLANWILCNAARLKTAAVSSLFWTCEHLGYQDDSLLSDSRQHRHQCPFSRHVLSTTMFAAEQISGISKPSWIGNWYNEVCICLAMIHCLAGNLSRPIPHQDNRRPTSAQRPMSINSNIPAFRSSNPGSSSK